MEILDKKRKENSMLKQLLQLPKGFGLLTPFVVVAATLVMFFNGGGAAQQSGEARLAAEQAANPVPLINQPLVPDATAPGGAGFTLTVNGTGFVSGSVVNWNGGARATTFVSSSELTAAILASDIGKPTTASVTVVSPSPGGGASNIAFFSVTHPTSSVTLVRVDYGGVTGPWGVSTGDFNGDGKLDLAVANSGGSTVSILLGNGDGTFQPAVGYTVGSQPVNISIADFNGDGKQDLAVANGFGTTTVSILLGNGDGTFQAAVNYPAGGSTPRTPVAADFNGDGKLDLAIANYDDATVSVLLGNGDGTLQSPMVFAVGQAQPDWLVTGDFNGDGKLDLATANFDNFAGNTVSVLLGNGDGTFQPYVDYPTGPAPTSIAVADFNGDGKLDLATCTGAIGGAISILLGNGDGSFQEPMNYAAGSGPVAVIAGDFNGDGKLDLAVSDINTNLVSLLLGRGDGTFENPSTHPVGASPRQLAAGDFNGDGRLDLVAANSGANAVSVLLQGTTVALSKTSLEFPTQLVRTTSPARTVTLANTGGLPLTISSIAASGDFLQQNNCGSGVAAGASCDIAVEFRPRGRGSRTGAVTITDNAPDNPQTITLTGTGTVVELSPLDVNFGSQAVGTISPPHTITLTNVGIAPLRIVEIGVGGPDFGDFPEATTCPSSLAAKASCAINIRFRPRATGTRRASVVVSDDGGASPQRVGLVGNGA
jgi:hypothetical protein